MTRSRGDGDNETLSNSGERVLNGKALIECLNDSSGLSTRGSSGPNKEADVVKAGFPKVEIPGDPKSAQVINRAPTTIAKEVAPQELGKTAGSTDNTDSQQAAKRAKNGLIELENQPADLKSPPSSDINQTRQDSDSKASLEHPLEVPLRDKDAGAQTTKIDFEQPSIAMPPIVADKSSERRLGMNASENQESVSRDKEDFEQALPEGTTNKGLKLSLETPIVASVPTVPTNPGNGTSYASAKCNAPQYSAGGVE